MGRGATTMAERLDGTEITEALVRQIEGGANWVERRDAAAALTMMIREGLLALRKAAEDKDPDVSHECKKSVELVRSDLTGGLKDIELELAAALRAYRADLAGSKPMGIPPSTPDGDEGEMAGAGVGEGRSGGTAKSGGTTRAELESWVRAIAERRGGSVRETEGQWVVEIGLEGDRKQTIFVDPDRKDSAGEAVAVMYTLCGPAEPKIYSVALKTNMQLSHAAFGLTKQGEKRLLALIGRRRIDELTQESLEEILEYLAKKGDRAESQLQADDEH
jgi:hypothetical protein